MNAQDMKDKIEFEYTAKVPLKGDLGGCIQIDLLEIFFLWHNLKFDHAAKVPLKSLSRFLGRDLGGKIKSK